MTKEERLNMIRERFNAHRLAEVTKLMDEPPCPEIEGIAIPTEDEIKEEAKSLHSFEEHQICEEKVLTSDEV